MERGILTKQKQPLLHILSATVVLPLYLSNLMVIFATAASLAKKVLLAVVTVFLNTQSKICLKLARVIKGNSKA